MGARPPAANGFHVRRIVWGLLMAREERRDDEEIRAAKHHGRGALETASSQIGACGMKARSRTFKIWLAADDCERLYVVSRHRRVMPEQLLQALIRIVLRETLIRRGDR